MHTVDLLGRRFGRLIVIERRLHIQPSGKKHAHWVCRCDCGRQSIVLGPNLIRGKQVSCGCLKDEQTRARRLTHGHTAKQKESREYRAWRHMKGRCYDPRDISYPNYGGRSIRVCEPWRQSFEAFLQDMGRCPDKCSLDRLDSNGNYVPGNCRWATHIEQMNNKRSNTRLLIHGQTMTLANAARRHGADPRLVGLRLRRGWSAERALGLSA